MRKLALLSVSLLLLGLPALAAACASCVSGPCSDDGLVGSEAGGKITVPVAELPPCHAAMALSLEPPPEPESKGPPCHADEEAEAPVAGLSCCADGELAPATLPFAPSPVAPGDWQLDAPNQPALVAESTPRLAPPPAQRGRPPSSAALALHVLKAVWLI